MLMAMEPHNGYIGTTHMRIENIKGTNFLSGISMFIYDYITN